MEGVYWVRETGERRGCPSAGQYLQFVFSAPPVSVWHIPALSIIGWPPIPPTHPTHPATDRPTHANVSQLSPTCRSLS